MQPHIQPRNPEMVLILENQLNTSAVDEDMFRYAKQEHKKETPTATYGTPHLLILPKHLGACPVCAMVNSDLVLANINALAADHALVKMHPLIMWGRTLIPAF